MHVPVLAAAVLDKLIAKKNGRYLDVTGGHGGHSRTILEALDTTAELAISDCDEEAVKVLVEKFTGEGRVKIFRARFSEIGKILAAESFLPVDGILADLGFSSGQLDDEKRGLSFLKYGKLDMRLDQRLEVTAADLLASATADELGRLFFEYGEERHARPLARAIVADRAKKPFLTSADLAGLCERVLGRYYRRQKIHPATRAFQALRIGVNRELVELQKLLDSLDGLLADRGRAAVIAFHSLEDRLVKNAFKEYARSGWNIMTKKPLRPSPEEMTTNPRSRSAKMRVIEKICHVS